MSDCCSQSSMFLHFSRCTDYTFFLGVHCHVPCLCVILLSWPFCLLVFSASFLSFQFLLLLFYVMLSWWFITFLGGYWRCVAFLGLSWLFLVVLGLSFLFSCLCFFAGFLVCSVSWPFDIDTRLCKALCPHPGEVVYLTYLFFGFSCLICFLVCSWLFLAFSWRFLGFSWLVLSFPVFYCLLLSFLGFSWLFCCLISHSLAYVYHPVVVHRRSGSSIASFDKLSAA